MSEGIKAELHLDGTHAFTFVDGRWEPLGFKNRDEAVDLFEAWLRGEDALHFEPARRREILRRLPELRGKVLGCWCAPERCHAEILERMAGEAT